MCQRFLDAGLSEALCVGIDQITPMPLSGFVFNFFDAIGSVLS